MKPSFPFLSAILIASAPFTAFTAFSMDLPARSQAAAAERDWKYIGLYDFAEAGKACSGLGSGWRLPEASRLKKQGAGFKEIEVRHNPYFNIYYSEYDWAASPAAAQLPEMSAQLTWFVDQKLSTFGFWAKDASDVKAWTQDQFDQHETRCKRGNSDACLDAEKYLARLTGTAAIQYLGFEKGKGFGSTPTSAPIKELLLDAQTPFPTLCVKSLL